MPCMSSVSAPIEIRHVDGSFEELPWNMTLTIKTSRKVSYTYSGRQLNPIFRY